MCVDVKASSIRYFRPLRDDEQGIVITRYCKENQRLRFCNLEVESVSMRSRDDLIIEKLTSGNGCEDKLGKGIES